MLRQVAAQGLRARLRIQQANFLAPQTLYRGFADEPSTGGSGGASAASNAEELNEEFVDEYEHKPPVPVHGIAGRYAAALYMSASKADLLEEIEVDLSEISNAAAESEQLRSFLKDPSIPRQAKQEALDAISDKLECEEITKNFLALLNENNRLGEFMKISTTFEELMAAARGEVLATITTAQKLEDSEIDEISESLQDLLKPEETLSVQTKVDPAIIGGVIVDIGDKHMDLSISSRIKKLQQLVMETSV